MTRVSVPSAVWDATLAQFRGCGQGRDECVVYWLARSSHISAITALEHPEHVAGYGSYQVSSAWISAFWLRLAHSALSVKVQVHTHAGRAFHSNSDDSWPLIHTPGFLSLVLPGFASSDLSLRWAYLAEYVGPGRWQERRVGECLAIV